ncbi:oxidoreductase C-terminal domain-containing protein, partial [Sphaerisporangium sp. NPDC049002]|uniref:oxidoreductase C-terminal domain-containing protein n=1 Tax=Sphaerisporangium sp. NPDC049002 TaxID=3155392 RepID=UPI0033DDA80A
RDHRRGRGLAGNLDHPDSRAYRRAPVAGGPAADQFDARIHVHGTPSADAEVIVVEGDLAARRFVALYRRDGTITAVLGWNMPKQARLRRPQIGDAAGRAPTL